MSTVDSQSSSSTLVSSKTELPEGLTAEQLEQFAKLAKEQANKVMSKVPTLGAVVWLMMQQANSKHSLISELDWRVMPALALDQAKLYMRDSFPIAYVSWAKMSETTAERYKQFPHQLTPTDWKSGEHIWLVDIVTPFGGAKEVLEDLRSKVFLGQIVNQLIPSELGATKSIAWPAVKR
jgi:cytolysin-activating lysine-acyltransferase